MKNLPNSYESGTLVSTIGGGAKITLHFGSVDEAELWFGDLIAEEAAQPVASEPSSGERVKLIKKLKTKLDDVYTHSFQGSSDEARALIDEIVSDYSAILSSDAKPASEQEDEYFAKRPQIDCNDRRVVFRAGFAAGQASEPISDPLWPVDGLYPDMQPPATSRDRWMFDQGRLAERRIAASEPVAVPQGWKLLKNSTHEERSWPDDAAHENGSYSCTCCNCGRQFTGHKRRAVCRVCSSAPSPAPVGIKKENQ